MEWIVHTCDSASESDDLPFYSEKDWLWQFTVLSFAVHVVMMCVAVFCVHAFPAHRRIDPADEIIMVNMVGDGPPMETLPGHGSGPGQKAVAEIPASAPVAPLLSCPTPSIIEKPRPAMPVSAPIKPKRPVSIHRAKPAQKVEKQPEPAPETANTNHAEAAPETPPVETAVITPGAGSASQSAQPDSGSRLSEAGNASGGSAGGPGGQGWGRGSGMGAGSGSGVVEGAFGSKEGPAFLHRVLPNFPRKAQVLGKEGVVVLRLTVDNTGRLVHVEVVSSAGYGFDEEAVRAVEKSSYSPAMRNGKPITCLALLSVKFQLASN